MSTLVPEVDQRPPAARPPRSPWAQRKHRRLLVVGCVLLAAAGFLVFKGLTSAIVYFKTADQAVAERSSLGTATFQIEGTVVPDTVRHTGPSSVDFSIIANGVTVAVHNQGVPPQLFQAKIPVVLVGHFLGTSNVFLSDEILVKHSNQYIAAHPARVRAPNGSVH